MPEELRKLSDERFVAALKNAITDDEADFWNGPDRYEFQLMTEALRRLEEKTTELTTIRRVARDWVGSMRVVMDKMDLWAQEPLGKPDPTAETPAMEGP